MNPSVHHSQRLILIGILITLSVLFFWGGPGYYSPRSFQAAWNLGHIIYFALLAVVILAWLRKKPRHPFIQILIVFGLTFAIGGFVELLQAGFQRTPDLGDLFRNLIGALCGIVFLGPTFRKIATTTRRAFQFFTIALVALQIYPVAMALLD